MSDATRQSKNQRRDAAREKAREQRERQQRRERRNRLVLQLSIGVVLVAIVAVVAVILMNSVRPPGPGPRNMANGGITLSGSKLAAVSTVAAGPSATPTPEATPDGKVRIQVWEDFGCPICQSFEQTNGPQIEQLVKSGAADVQYFPVAFLDRVSPNQYSTRAANAAAAVADFSPDTYQAFVTRMYETSVQPKEGSAGPSDERLVQIIRQLGAKNMSQIETSIKDGRFENWTKARTDDFLNDRGALSKVDFSQRVNPDGSKAGPGTPTVIVNGQYYNGGPNDASAFGSFVTRVGGAIDPNSTPTPTPSPSASK